jgi:D-tyrosyl-tRNA(Tyr) deacylase
MRLIIQSVQSACVTIIDQSLQKKIGRGIVIYLGIHTDDSATYPEKIEKIIKKLPTIKFLVGETGTIDQSLNDIKGEILLISNFTVYGRNHKGTKMDFVHSAPFEQAKAIYEYFVSEALKA